MLLYADECFPRSVVVELRQLGHDVVTVHGDGRSGGSDLEILERAHSLGRAVLTHNRRHFIRLHESGVEHSGILTSKQDPHDSLALARRIDAALAGISPGRWHIPVRRTS
jgi:Domain of unknown function (DUF5615)